MKKFLSIILTICIILSLCVLPVNANKYGSYDDSFSVTFGGKTLPLSEYNPMNGSIYFTYNGKSCSTHRTGRSSNCKDFKGIAWQCLGFAFYVQDSLFGFYYQNTSGLNKDKFNVIKNFNTNPNDKITSTKNLFSNVTLGAHIRTKKGHSMIFASSNSDYIWTYEANTDFRCGIHYRKRTWAEMYDYLDNNLNYIASPKTQYYNNSTTYTDFQVKEEIRKTKPTIDVTQYPTLITQGSSFGLRGTISSTNNVTSVKGYIINSNGNTVMSTSDYPDSTSNNIRYLNLNQDMLFNDLTPGNYTLKIEAKDASGGGIAEWKQDFTVKSKKTETEVKPNTNNANSCNHKYNDRGYCRNCGEEYQISISLSLLKLQTTKNDVPVRNRPYSPEKIINYLSKGTKVSVVASGKNSVGNLWYKLEDGTWIYSGNLERISSNSSNSGSTTHTSSSSATHSGSGVSFASNSNSNSNSTSIKMSLDSVPSGSLAYGKPFTLSGKFTSDCAIVEARAYLLDANKNIIMDAKGSSTTNNYYIKGYALDNGMKFNKLSPGGYYLKYFVKDANGDTATWVSDMFYIVK